MNHMYTDNALKQWIGSQQAPPEFDSPTLIGTGLSTPYYNKLAKCTNLPKNKTSGPFGTCTVIATVLTPIMISKQIIKNCDNIDDDIKKIRCHALNERKKIKYSAKLRENLASIISDGITDVFPKISVPNYVEQIRNGTYDRRLVTKIDCECQPDHDYMKDNKKNNNNNNKNIKNKLKSTPTKHIKSGKKSSFKLQKCFKKKSKSKSKKKSSKFTPFQIKNFK